MGNRYILREWGHRCVFVIIVATGSSGCDDYPRDPENTYDKVSQSKVVKIGVIEEKPWAHRRNGLLAGVEVQLAGEFAETIPARPEWHFVSEAQAVKQLERLELDLVIGGLTQDSPRGKAVGFTRPYLKTGPDIEGKIAKHVLAVPLGENRWLIELEKFLKTQEPLIRKSYENAVSE